MCAKLCIRHRSVGNSRHRDRYEKLTCLERLDDSEKALDDGEHFGIRKNMRDSEGITRRTYRSQ